MNAPSHTGIGEQKACSRQDKASPMPPGSQSHVGLEEPQFKYTFQAEGFYRTKAQGTKMGVHWIPAQILERLPFC